MRATKTKCSVQDVARRVRANNEDWNALEYATDELCGDKEIVLAAVKGDGRALEYATKELQGDRDIVLEAVKHVHPDALPYLLKHVSAELQGDQEILLQVGHSCEPS